MMSIEIYLSESEHLQRAEEGEPLVTPEFMYGASSRWPRETRALHVANKAFTDMLDHLCDSSQICSQMWFQDVAEEALFKIQAILEGTNHS